jgi:hypothetical protein
MPATPPIARETLYTLITSLGRVRDHIEQASECAKRLQHDHHAEAERHAIALITTTGRIAEDWRALRGELETARDAIEDAQNDLDDLEDRLDQDEILEAEDALTVPDDTTPESEGMPALRPAARAAASPGAEG